MFNKSASSTETTATPPNPVVVTPTPVSTPAATTSIITPVQAAPVVTPTATTQQTDSAPPPTTPKSSHKLLFIVTGIILLLALGIGMFVMANGGLPSEPGESLLPAPTQEAAPTPDENEAVACTMDAKICPDGSSVGRVAPSCEFAPCPDEETDTTEEASPAASTETDINLDLDTTDVVE